MGRTKIRNRQSLYREDMARAQAVVMTSQICQHLDRLVWQGEIIPSMKVGQLCGH